MQNQDALKPTPLGCLETLLCEEHDTLVIFVCLRNTGSSINTPCIVPSPFWVVSLSVMVLVRMLLGFQ